MTGRTHARQPTGRSRSAGFSRPAVLGFLLPFALLIVVALALHHASKPVPSPSGSSKAAASADTSDAGTPNVPAPAGAQPTADEVTAAGSAILAYCRNDIRWDEACTLMPSNTTTAPGFVEIGLQETGSFAKDGTNGLGAALAKGSGSNWTVIWIGQGCIPKDVAGRNGVPPSFDICSS